MKEIFATIYEVWLGLFNQDFDLIFSNLFDNGGYIKMGLSFVLVPLVCFLLFYYLWKYPYGKLWHWLLWLGIIFIIVFGVTYSIASGEIFSSNNQALNDAIADSSTGYQNYGSSLPFKYALWNGMFSIIMGVIYSFFMKRFSKIQIHLPF